MPCRMRGVDRPEERHPIMTDEGAQRKAHVGGPAAGEATHSPDGVDLTLIRWMLSLTPEERLEVLQANVRSILTLRDEETEA